MKVTVVGLVVMSLTDCGGSATCNVACDDSIELDAALAVPTSSLTGATVTVCQNAACGSGELAAQGDDFAAATLAGALDGEVSITAGALMTSNLAGTTSFADGDVWTLNVTTAAGVVAFHGSATVQYQTVSACGETCLQASVALTGSSAATP